MARSEYKSKRGRSNVRFDRLLRGCLGNKLTLFFLKSKYVKMMSEGDYVYRLRVLVRTLWLIPFYSVFFLLYVYYKFSVRSMNLSDTNQIQVLNVCVIICGYHLILITVVFIYFLFKSMDKWVWVFGLVYNLLYISEVLMLCSVCFLLKWGHLLVKVTSFSQALDLLETYWFFIIFYIFVLIILKPLHSIFKDIQMWTREWERIEKYQDTKDKENAFIFKRWITPEEVKARGILKVTALFGLILANIVIVADVFVSMDFTNIAYFFLIFSYLVFIGGFIVPFNEWSLIYYWLAFLITTVQLIYCFYEVQNNAWRPGQWYLYSYLYSILPWIASLRSALIYTWIIKDKPEIRAIVINQFETPEDFEEFLKDMDNNDEKLYASESVDENKIDYSTNSI